MHNVHLETLDLNLLFALRALLAERHVTRAAARVGLSQPAMSHALGRLRVALSDPLLVRTADGLVRTPRADALAEPLERILEDLARVLAPPKPFDPESDARQFRIAALDYVGLVLVPKLVARLRSEAPNVDLRIENQTDASPDDLSRGRLDAILGVTGTVTDAQGFSKVRLLSDDFVCVVRTGHPRVGKTLSLDLWTSLPHALIAPRGATGSVVDAALAKIGRRRRVAIELPHFLVAPHVVRETDVVLTLAKRIAQAYAKDFGLRHVPPPIELAGFTVAMYWHARHQHDPAHAWFRSVVSDVAKVVSHPQSGGEPGTRKS